MSTHKSTVPIDDNLISSIGIAADFSQQQEEERHYRIVVTLANVTWLIEKMTVSKQFTPEQQEALKQLLSNAQAYQDQEVPN